MKRTPDAIAEVAGEPTIVKAAFSFVAFSVTIFTLAMLLAAHLYAKPAPQDKTDPVPNRTDQPVELGDVHWLRDLNTAVAKSKKQNKPIAILFQEVPG